MIEDDYDAEFCYDRTPIGAVQGLDPREGRSCRDRPRHPGPRRAAGQDRRPDDLAEQLVTRKSAADSGSPALGQLVLAYLLSSGEYERHIAAARRAYRHRRHLLIRALLATLPGLQVRGAAAGMQPLLQLPDDTDHVAPHQLGPVGPPARADRPMSGRWSRRSVLLRGVRDVCVRTGAGG